MSLTRLLSTAFVVIGTGAVATISGCGSSSDDNLSADQVATVKAEALREFKAEQRRKDADRKLAQIEKELKQLKKSKKKDDKRAVPSASSGGNSASSAPSGSSCGGGISVNSVTSCSFASNVASAFYSHGSGTVYATSPVTGQTYAMSCSGGVPTVCTGGNGAAVYIR